MPEENPFELPPSQMLIDVNRVIKMCSRHYLNLSPEEMILLILLKTKDVPNIYRFAYEVPMRTGEKLIDSTIFDSLEDKGMIRLIPGYDPKLDPLTDKYDIIEDRVNQLFLDLDQAVNELLQAYPATITSESGQQIITRNIPEDELKTRYAKIVGFITETVDQTYTRATPKGAKNVRKQTKALELCDAAMHKRVINGILAYRYAVETNRTHAVGLDKFLSGRLWEGFEELTKNTHDYSEDY